MEESHNYPVKPLGHKAYGSIPHLPSSRLGPGDHHINEAQARICTEKPRDKHDEIIVQEKLDGSNVAVAKIGTDIVPLIRSGYVASTSHYRQHHLFHIWALTNWEQFDALLYPGERVVGEWLALAHGTRYQLPHEPFVVFDIMEGHKRLDYDTFTHRCQSVGLVTPRLIHRGRPISVDEVVPELEHSGHGALDPVEGAVWRVQRRGEVDFLAKWVRSDKVDGKYFDNETWNWMPNNLKDSWVE